MNPAVPPSGVRIAQILLSPRRQASKTAITTTRKTKGSRAKSCRITSSARCCKRVAAVEAHQILPAHI